MALTVRKITDQQIESAKFLTGKGTASAAVVACIDLAYQYHNRDQAQKEEIKRLKERVELLERVQAKLANAADEALCIVRQRELL